MTVEQSAQPRAVRPPDASARRAMALDARLHREALAGMVILAVLVVGLAALRVDLVWVLIVLGVLTPYAIARTDREADAAVRAGLGISRAAAVRGRHRLILVTAFGLGACVLVAEMLLTLRTGAPLLFDVYSSPTSDGENGTLLGQMLEPRALVWIPAITWGIVLILGECARMRRPSYFVAITALASAAFMWWAVGIIGLAVPDLVFDSFVLEPWHAARSSQLVSAAAVLVLTAAGSAFGLWRARAHVRRA